VGGQLGCNIQNGQIVFGIEGEAASGLSETTQTSITGSPQKISGRNRWNADLAARAGLAVDRALVYGKIGLAQGDFAFSISDSFGDSQIGSGTLTGLLLVPASNMPSRRTGAPSSDTTISIMARAF
jgi:outer membrane immunogenic protein